MLTANIKAEVATPLNMTWEQMNTLLHGMRRSTWHALNATVTDMAIIERQGKPPRPLRTMAYHSVGDELAKRGEAMTGAMKSCVSSFAHASYVRYTKELRKGMSRSLPSFKPTCPVLVRGDSWKPVPDDAGYAIDVTLTANQEPLRVALVVCGGSAHANMRRMLSGDGIKRGDMKLKWDERKRKWLAIMSYSFPEPEKRTGGCIAVHRGMTAMLYAAAEDGFARPIVDGGDVLALKAQMLARKRSIGLHRPELGDGAKGHGRKRRFAAIEALQGKEARFTTTKCQQAAAATVKLAIERGAGTVLVEDFGGIDDDTAPWMVKRWPWAKLKECIVWACKKAGLETVEVGAAYNTKTCPKCGATDSDVVVKGGHFQCVACGLHHRTDAIACWNMLRKHGAETGVDAAQTEHQAKMKRVRKPKEA